MPQVQMPLFPPGSTDITNEIAFMVRDEKVAYFHGQLPIFIHDKNDIQSFRMFTSEMISTGVVTQAQISRTFCIPLVTVKRYAKLYRQQGPGGFYKERPTRGAAVLTQEVLTQAQKLLDENKSRREVATQLMIKINTLAKAIQAGHLHESKKKTPLAPSAETTQSTTRSQRSMIDAAAPMGMGATNTLDRTGACFGLVNGVKTDFATSDDVIDAGVLTAVPALLSLGLLNDIESIFNLPPGYYTMQQLFLTIAFMALCRIKTFEQLRYCPPGEWGKLLGIDRIPEVHTLREKVHILAQQAAVEKWSAQIRQGLMQQDSPSAGVLYVDGHVRVYHGSMTQLPRHYVARQHLCLRATVDYWVNAFGGQPFFRVNCAIDPGLQDVLKNQIVPILEKEVPNQPTDQQLSQNPLLHRFCIVFDREGYSPEFFLEMKLKRIAVITYNKYPGDQWELEEFRQYTAIVQGSEVKVLLAERGIKLSNNLWVREIRKLTDSGHQTSLLATDYVSDMVVVAITLFARWCQENFLKYMIENYCLNRLIQNKTEKIPGTIKVVNPLHRELDGKVRSSTAKNAKLMQQFGSLHCDEQIDVKDMESFEAKKANLKLEIDTLAQHIAALKQERKKTPRHIPISELPQQNQFEQLSPHIKNFVDMIRLIAYRVETALASIAKEHLTDGEDARMLVKRLFKSEADIIAEKDAGILRIRLHHQCCASQDRVVQGICKELNETKTKYPGTDMVLVYEILET